MFLVCFCIMLNMNVINIYSYCIKVFFLKNKYSKSFLKNGKNCYRFCES